MRTATVEYESARSPVPQEISGPVLNWFEHPRKDKTKTWLYRESKQKVVIVLHGSDIESEVRQTSDTMGEAMAAALAKGQLVGEHPGQTLGDMRQTQLNDGDVSISFETDIYDDLAEVYD